MADINKINEKLNDENFMRDLLDSKDKYITETHVITINGEPESYARERKGRGKHFYNPKSKKMEEFKLECIRCIGKGTTAFLKDLIEKTEDMQVKMSMKYYIPIQKSSSIKNAILKEKGFIKPNTRPDLDNYDKFILDSLHGLFYNDDCVVVKIESEKLYSLNPRTELSVEIIYKPLKNNSD